MSGTGRRRLLAATVLLGLGASAACSEDEARPPPPPVIGHAVDNPRACSELQSAQAGDASLFLEGGEANCAVNGQYCPLLSASFSGMCDAGFQASGQCAGQKWRFGCQALDAGSERRD